MGMKTLYSKSRPKFITFFLPALSGGGAERAILNLAIELNKKGYKVNFFLVHKIGAYLKYVPEEIQILSFEGLIGKRFKMPQSIIPLIHYLKKEKPDVLLSAMNPCNFIAIIAKLISKAQTKIAINEQNTFSSEIQHTSWFRKKIDPYLIKFLYPKADFIIAVSKGVADDLSKISGIPKNKINIIYNPVNVAEISEKSKEKILHPFFQEKSNGIIINVANLNKQKNHLLLIETFSILRKIRDVRLIILGEGEERKNLEKIINKLNLWEFISMPGFVENPYAYIAQSNVFVLSSLYEGLPTVLIEAMACGTSIVSTDCPSGPAEILENGQYGKLVPINDPEALAEAIKETLDNPINPQVLRERANYFSTEKAADRYLELLFKNS